MQHLLDICMSVQFLHWLSIGTVAILILHKTNHGLFLYVSWERVYLMYIDNYIPNA